AFGYADALWLALALLALAGAADFVSAVLRSTILLTATPDSMRGRLSGIEFAQVASAPSLGNLEAGVVASLTSLRFSVVSGGIACVEEGVADAVLLRAIEPVEGVEAMRARRGLDDLRLLCAGPGRLCQALGVTREHDGLPLDEAPFELRGREAEPEIVRGPRIGITRAAEIPWRFAVAGSPFLSRPLRPRPGRS